MAKMADLNARGVTNLYSYNLGRLDERGYLRDAFEGKDFLQKLASISPDEDWRESVRVIIVATVLFTPPYDSDEDD